MDSMKIIHTTSVSYHDFSFELIYSVKEHSFIWLRELCEIWDDQRKLSVCLQTDKINLNCSSSAHSLVVC